jgi:DNA processing protein
VPLSTTALRPLLRLALVPGIGPGRLSLLLARFGSAERVLGATAAEIAAVPRMGPELAGRVAAASGPEGEERVRVALEAMQGCGAVVITPDDLAYPEAFRHLPDPPFLLFASGNLDLLGQPGIGVVGTRSPTDYGVRATRALAGELAQAGYMAISGMARGIDTAAHTASLETGAGTIGVLGNGIDVVYPPENRRLFARVREQGLLITELAPGEQPLSGNFPRRNRLIAALSQGVLVVEMGAKSGALHTVTYALEQGKDVFAVPGPIGSAASEGTNQLLKEGARLVTSAADVLEELRGVGSAGAPRARADAPLRLDLDASTPAPKPPPPDLAPEEAKVFAVLGLEPKHVDDLAAAVDLAPSNVLAALLGLELKGVVAALPGKHFRLA